MILQTSKADKSCLGIEFYHSSQELKFDTLINIDFEKNKIYDLMFNDDSSLQLVIVFRNLCAKSIAIPTLYLDQPWQSNFTIFGQEIRDSDTINMSMDIEYDYYREDTRDGRRYNYNVLPANQIKVQKFNYLLGFTISESGLYRFRLRHTIDEECYDNENCYSNWLYIRFK